MTVFLNDTRRQVPIRSSKLIGTERGVDLGTCPVPLNLDFHLSEFFINYDAGVQDLNFLWEI